MYTSSTEFTVLGTHYFSERKTSPPPVTSCLLYIRMRPHHFQPPSPRRHQDAVMSGGEGGGCSTFHCTGSIYFSLSNAFSLRCPLIRQQKMCACAYTVYTCMGDLSRKRYTRLYYKMGFDDGSQKEEGEKLLRSSTQQERHVLYPPAFSINDNKCPDDAATALFFFGRMNAVLGADLTCPLLNPL